MLFAGLRLCGRLAAVGCTDADAPARTPGADPVVELHIQLMIARISAIDEFHDNYGILELGLDQ